MARVDYQPSLAGAKTTPTATSDLILVAIETLRPTQMAVGMRAVVSKRRKFEDRTVKRKRLDKVLSGRPIPTVRGPGGQLFIVDHHHFGLALWQAEVQQAYAHVIEDLSHLSLAAFWRQMEEDGRLYPFDEEGRRVKPQRLPTWLHALRHDPYRDLAGQVRDAGVYRKSAIPYAEFHWANFFRSRIADERIGRDPSGALKLAVKLARSPQAAHLPGFIATTA